MKLGISVTANAQIQASVVIGCRALHHLCDEDPEGDVTETLLYVDFVHLSYKLQLTLLIVKLKTNSY